MLQKASRPEAEREFREACDLDPESLAAHSGLARALEKSNPEEARKQAQEALRVGVSVEALLVLGRLIWKKINRTRPLKRCSARSKLRLRMPPLWTCSG